MEVLVKWPPNIGQIRKRFNLNGKHPIFTFGNQIYNPYGNPLPQHLIVHESVHSVQQEMFGEIGDWWERYLVDKEFRLSQELQAYQKQFKEIVETSGRQVKREWLKRLAKDLSSSLYGNLVSFEEAKQLIENYV